MENYKRLFRSKKDRVFGGVCGGIGKFIGVDPVIIRLIWAFLLVFGGVGLILYLFSWIIIPNETPEDCCNCKKEDTKENL
jgi:phage shock protein C